MLGAPASVDVEIEVAVGDRNIEVATVEVNVRVGIGEQGVLQENVHVLAFAEGRDLLVDVVHLDPGSGEMNSKGRHGWQSRWFCLETEGKTGADGAVDQSGRQAQGTGRGRCRKHG